jgi:hypothetical protein
MVVHIACIYQGVKIIFMIIALVKMIVKTLKAPPPGDDVAFAIDIW